MPVLYSQHSDVTVSVNDLGKLLEAKDLPVRLFRYTRP